LLTAEGAIEQFPCFYCAQSAGTVISPDHKCTTSGNITKWEQEGDTRTGKGAICFRNRTNNVVATLPTYRRNGLWYTELSAIPAASSKSASIYTLQAHEYVPELACCAITDSDRHYRWTATDISVSATAADISASATDTTKPKAKPAPTVKTVPDNDNDNDNDKEANVEALVAAALQQPSTLESIPYPDPHISPPNEPPPKQTKNVSFQSRSRDPTAPHIEDLDTPTNPSQKIQKPETYLSPMGRCYTACSKTDARKP
jgi:hypothetical protein